MAAPLTVPIAQAASRSQENSQPVSTESVGAILTRCKSSLIADWLTRTKKLPNSTIFISATTNVPDILRSWLTIWWRAYAEPKCPIKTVAVVSPAAIEHGKLRRKQGCSSAMLIHESRILQVTIFGTLHETLNTLDFNLLLPDVMIIADEVDAQLTQTMDSFTHATPTSAKAHLVKPQR